MVLAVSDILALLPLAKNKTTRDMLMYMYIDQYIEPPLIPTVCFSHDGYPNANSLLDFRFDVVGIKRLGYLLGLPAVIITNNNTRICRDEAMCILLSRLTFPR